MRGFFQVHSSQDSVEAPAESHIGVPSASNSTTYPGQKKGVFLAMKKLIALLLVLALLVQILPTYVFAENDASDTSPVEAVEMETGETGKVVLGEMTDRRGQTEKHFRMNDGSYVAVDYGAPVHFTTDEGETWEDIDNTLTLSRDETNLYTSENGNAARSFAADLRSGLLFTASDGEHSLRMGLASGESADNDNAAEESSTQATDGIEPASNPGNSSEEGNLSASSVPAYNPAAAAEIRYPDEKNRGTEDLSLAEQVTPTRLHAQVLYQNVFDDVDLQYDLYSYDVKETILVNRPLADYSFSFSLNLDELTPVLMDDGSIELRDADGETIYLIPAPYMTDAVGAYSDAVSYGLEHNTDGWKLTITADENWTNAADRIFPVSIDPTVIDLINWTAQGLATTYVVQGAPTETHTHYQDVDFGKTIHQPRGEYQIYVGVDSVPPIPEGSEVVRAYYVLMQKEYNCVGANAMIAELYEVTQEKPSNKTNYEWIYERCWNNKPSIDSVVLDYTELKSEPTQNFIEWDVTALAKKWYQTEQGSSLWALQTRAFSIKLRDPEAYGNGNYAIATFDGYGSYGPILIVTYRDMTGIEPYYSYQTLGADRAGAAYISDYTGALTTVTPLVSYASTVNPFSLSLVYNSSCFKGAAPDEKNIPVELGYGMRMGSGMKLDILQKVEYVDLQCETEGTGTKRYIKYTDGDGTAHYFEPDDKKQQNETATTTFYYDEDGLGLKITEYATNYFRMEDDKGNSMVFVHGFFTYTEDTNGNKIQIRFSDSSGNCEYPAYPYTDGYRPHHIEQINNGQGTITVATFDYNSDDGANTLHSITDAAGNVYTFHYSNHKLRSISRNSEPYVEFVHNYNSTSNRYDNPVVGLRDNISGYELHFDYTDSKISGYCEKVGNTEGAGANISRVPGEKTTYTDWGIDRTHNTADDISTTYLFDYAGRTVNAFSADADGAILGASNAVYTGTGSTDKTNNRTMCSAGIGMAGFSMVRNGGFELSGSSLDWTAVVPENSSCFSTVKTGELTHTGTKAYKTWVSSSAAGPTGAKKLIGILPAGETYTASVYVNTSAASGIGDKGIYLRILDSYGSYKTSEYLNYKTDPDIDGGWVKLSFTFTTTHTANHYVCIYDEGVRGAVYYDDLQVEAGDAYTNVNLLDNGGITSSAAGWLTESNATPTVANVTAIQGDKALQITGNPKTNKYIHQTVALNQPGTQTYVLSGWAKANAVPDNENPEIEENETEEHYHERVATDTNKQFGLRAVLTYDDNTTEAHYVPFNADVTDWQFTSLTIVPKQPTKTVSSLQVFCAYEKNANTAYFDNLSLVKEVAQTMKYDEDGNLVFVQSSGTKEETSTYDNGNMTQVKTGGSGTFDYSYDNQHNLTEATNGTVKENYTYDSVGNAVTAVLSKAEGTPDVSETIKGGKTYTNSGNLVLTDKGANGCYTTFTYGTDASKMFGAATTVRNPVGTETVTSYLNDGRVNSSKINGNIAVTRSYDSKNQLTKLTRGGYNGDDPTAYHQYYNFTYDAFGNTTAISVGNTSASTYNLGTYTYAPKDGLLTGMTYGNGATVSYTYDNYGRKIQTDTSSFDQYKYTYTGDGQLYEMKDVSGSLLYRYTYDTLGRLIGSSLKSGSTVTLQTQHQYDEANRLSKQVWTLPGKTYQENYVYDEHNGRLTKKKITIPNRAAENITLGYDDLSRVSSVATPETTTVYSYYGAFYGGGTTGLASELTTTSVHTGSNVFAPLHLQYTYDALGNISSEKKINPDNSIAETIYYAYDNQSQLTQAVSTLNGTWNYQYDTYGNIRHQDHGSNAINYTYGDSNWRDLLTAVSGTKNGNSFSGSYVYDGAGNPTSFYNVGDLSTWTMTWRNGRELATASNGTHSVSYDYDVNGLRTYKIVDGVRHDYVYASGQLLRESFTLDGHSYVYDFLYDQSGRPYMLNYISNGYSSRYYYVLNMQGDVMALVTSEGVEVAKYTYDAWGNVTPDTTLWLSVRNPLRYRGYYYDSETGWYYLQSRYYDPALGRFLNADCYASTGQGFLGYNMFAYCNNNPISFMDSNGHMAGGKSCCVAVADISLQTHKNDDEIAFLYNCRDNNVKTYATLEAAATAWAKENRKQSQECERMSYIYEAYGHYFYDNVYKGSAGYGGIIQPNVIWPTFCLQVSRYWEHKYRVAAHIHTHPQPQTGMHNDYPSMSADITGGDRIAMEVFRYPEMFIVPYTSCSGNDIIIRITDESTWCPNHPYK